MRASAVEISWHEQEPVLSVDTAPGPGGRFLTAGADRAVRIWQRISSKKPPVELRASLSLTSTINVARFSPRGTTPEMIATGGDAADVVLWERNAIEEVDSKSEAHQERWKQRSSLRGHVRDVLDVAWSRDGLRLASASVDNSVFIWDVPRARKLQVIEAHHNFVQGVSWDPVVHLVSTMSSDRHLKTFELRPYSTRAYSSSSTADYRLRGVAFRLGPVPPKPVEPMKAEKESDAQDLDGRRNPDKLPKRLFLSGDQSLFFRRLSWSPDGSFLACPAGVHETRNAVHLFRRDDLSNPIAHLTGFSRPTVVIRFCQRLFELPQSPVTETEHGLLINLPYRIAFAVCTDDQVLIYFSDLLSRPVAAISGLHLEPLTDIAWAADGSVLWISSLDGYVSVVEFDVAAEFGPALPDEAYPAAMKQVGQSTGPLNKALAVPPPEPKHAAPLKVIPRKKPKPLAQNKEALNKV